jgi:hypothetical protein
LNRTLLITLISDDDDYDPTAQINERVADAVAVVGIVDEVKKEPEPSEKAAEKPKPAKASTSATAKVYKDLSKTEVEELQKRHDMEMFASVLGKLISGNFVKF